MKTLKYEEVYRADYRDELDVRKRIGRFIDSIYNERRLHSALGYQSPGAFERALPPVEIQEAAARQHAA